MVQKTCYILFFILALSCSKTDKERAHQKPGDPELIASLKILDERLPEPKPDDWLYSNHEKGQSFEQYKLSKPVKPDSVRHTIFIQPIGTFTLSQDSVIRQTAIYLNIFFGVDTKLLPPLHDNVIAQTNRRKISNGNEQLLTTDILNYLRSAMPQDGMVMMAITSKDLYAGENYNFVFGQARAKHRVAVSSLFRYQADLADSAGYRLCLERIIKTSAHEIGHMLSCQHCTNALCLMNGSNSLRESDSRPNRVCSECHQKLQWSLGFSVVKRVNGLKNYFKKHQLERDYLLHSEEMRLLNAW